jgi:hypothetical protein
MARAIGELKRPCQFRDMALPQRPGRMEQSLRSEECLFPPSAMDLGPAREHHPNVGDVENHARRGVDVVLSDHDHSSERFAPLKPDGNVDMALYPLLCGRDGRRRCFILRGKS